MRSSKVRTRSALRSSKPNRATALVASLLFCAAARAQQDHVGKPVPEYVHGDECLFCHRNDIGNRWQKNRHALTVRQREDAPELVKKLNPPAEVEFFLGSREHVRYLKKAGYGKFAILSPEGEWEK